MKKISKIKYIVFIIIIILVGVILLTSNPYKLFYVIESPVSYADAMKSSKVMMGYPAGDDIPVAKSINDIKNNTYCTIEVSRENIKSTRVFYL